MRVPTKHAAHPPCFAAKQEQCPGASTPEQLRWLVSPFTSFTIAVKDSAGSEYEDLSFRSHERVASFF
jgi:hypothetical protein